jgi:hypothetical protein
MLDAGAGGVIGGLWALGDQGASGFAARFYDALGDDPKVAYALRKAREGYYETGDPTYLAYVLYGDPNLTLRRAAPVFGELLSEGAASSKLEDAFNNNTGVGVAGGGAPPARPPKYVMTASTNQLLSPDADVAAVNKVIRRRTSSLRRCFSKNAAHLANAPIGRGEFMLKLAANGRVEGFDVSGSFPPKGPVRACLGKAARKIRFAARPDGQPMSLRVKFEFDIR